MQAILPSRFLTILWILLALGAGGGSASAQAPAEEATAGAPPVERPGPQETGTSPGPPPLTDAEIAELVEQLGDPRWGRRELATGQLLAAGPRIVAALRSRRDDPDPEVRHRVRWILEFLDPETVAVRIVQLGGDPPPPAPVDGAPPPVNAGPRPHHPLVPVQWGVVTVVGSHTPTRVRLTPAPGRNSSTEVQVTVLSAEEPVVVEVSFARDGEGRLTRSLTPGGIALLRLESLVEVESALGRVRRARTDFAWVIERLDRSAAGSSPTPRRSESAAAVTDALRTAIARALHPAHGGPTRDAIHLAGLLGDRALLEEGPGRASPARDLHGALLLAQLRAGVPNAQQLLEQWLADTGRGEEARAEVALALAETGSTAGLDALLEELPTLGGWPLQRAIEVLEEIVRRAELEPDRVAQFYAVVSAPDVFPFLPWQGDQACRALFQALAAHIPADRLSQDLPRLLTSGPTNTFRVRSLCVLLQQARTRGAPLSGETVDALLQLFADAFTLEPSFCLLRDALLAGELDEEQWQRFDQVVRDDYARGDAGFVTRLDRLLDGLLGDPKLPPDRRLALWRTRVDGFPNMQAYQRGRVDAALCTLLGAPSSPPPQQRDSEGWNERTELWRSRLAAGSEIALPDSAGWVHTYVVRLRLDDDARTSRVLDFDHRRVPIGHTVSITDGEVTDRSTIRIEKTSNIRRAHAYRWSNSTVSAGTPVARADSANRYDAFLLSEDDFRPRTTTRPHRRSFRTLQLLLEDEEGVPGTWDELVSWIVAGCRDEDLRLRDSRLAIVAQLYLQPAREELAQLFAEKPELSVARTLLELGDPRGRDLLIGHLKERPQALDLQLLESLVKRGDDEALQLALQWLESPPTTLRNQQYRILRVLDPHLRSHPEEVDREHWIEAVGACLRTGPTAVRATATQMLRQLTGRNFGFQETYRQYTDARARTEAQNRIVQRWIRWMDNHRQQQRKQH